MIVATGIAYVARPTIKLADQGPKIDLGVLIPMAFGNWKVDSSVVPISVSPDVQARLDKVYNQTLSRTYVNQEGQRVMLSIAYGGDQSSDDSQVHRPEFCYSAQGFQVLDSRRATTATDYGELVVRRLLAVQATRREPITYWITIGEKATLPGIGRKLTQLAYGITGKVPDGMLVRVSSIDPSSEAAYQTQDLFIGDLLRSIDPQFRARVSGDFPS